MPTYDPATQTKIDALELLTGAARKPAEICAIYWPSPAGTKIYAAAAYTDLPWWPNLAAAITTRFGLAIPITLTLMPDARAPFRTLPRTTSVGDDSITLTFSDLDDVFSDLLMDYGEGIRVEVFGYWPGPDLLLSLWRGHLHAPKEMSRGVVKVAAAAGFRSPQLLLPRRPHATSCPFIFGALLTTQAEIDYHRGCPYNRHLVGGLVGVPGFTDCPRRTLSDCTARLATDIYWPSFETRPDPIANNQTKGPNLQAYAYGNESNLNEPVRAIFGERYVKSLNLLAYRNELNNNTPEEGFGAALFEVGEGLMLALWDFRIGGVLVDAEHQQHRLGEWGQSKTTWSPNVSAYSNTAVIWGRILGDFTDAGAGEYSGSVRAIGLADIRVYTGPTTYTEAFTKNRMWGLLESLANARWGYGNDYSKYDIASAITVATWCDEQITLTAPDGEKFSGVRSTFNAELTGRATQQQIKDICTAGRIGLPFEFEGKDVFVPLKVENTADPLIPTFTDEGANRNIVYDGADSSLEWSYLSDDTLTNQWTINFDDHSNGGVDTQLIFGDQRQQLRAGRAWGDRSVRVINKSQAAVGITNEQEAARLGVALLYLGPLDSGGILNPWQVKFTTHYAHTFDVRNYALIKVVNAKLQALMTAYFTARGLVPYAGANHTNFRVMRYERKGDLKVEITAQSYATVAESAYECTCDPDEIQQSELGVNWVVLSDAADSSVKPDNSIELLAGPLAEAVSTETFDGASCTTISFPLLTAMQEGEWSVLVEDADGANRYGITFHMFGGSLLYRPVTNGVPGLSGSHGVMSWPSTYRHRLYLPGDGTMKVQYSTSAVGAWLTPYTLTGLPTNIIYRVRGAITTTGKQVPPVSLSSYSCAGIPAAGAGGFSYPRDFKAVVNDSTGVVQFSWSPPALGAQFVTGYTMYAADGVTVVMPTALVYNHQLTLAVGTYTFKLRATDGVNNSAFVSVTFTVNTPPLTDAELYVIDDITLEDVMDDTALVNVTA